MADVDALRSHLADRYGFRAQTMFNLDEDVVLLRDGAGVGWVARVFPAERPLAAVEGDAAVLAWLEEVGYPAERRAREDCVSVLEDRPVLVTRQVQAVARARRRQAIKDAGGIRAVGELLGRLACLAPPSGDAARPGGAWHHMASGDPSAELAAAGEWLEQAEQRAGVRELAHFARLADELEALDDGAALPSGYVHPDFVLANIVATPQPGMVVVDWAGAGIGPRAWALAFLLWAEGAKDLRRAALALLGYRQHVKLEAAELDRLAAMIRARPLIFDIWRLHHSAMGAADAVQHAADNRRLADVIAEKARAAFARGA